MKLFHFGFFDDLPIEERRNAIQRFCSQGQTHPDAEKILSYLRAGVPIMLIAGITRDWLSENRAIIGPPHVLTDGTWAWTMDVCYYIERYAMHPPEEFVTHMKLNQWKVPTVENLHSLEL